MTHYRNKYNSGYVGLLALLIVVTIIVFLMAKEYESYGIIPSSSTVGTSTTMGTPATSATPANQMTPLQQAQNAKNILEAQDRSTSEQEK